MTVIAYRDGVLAADTASFRGQTRYLGATKIARASDGVLAAAAGDAAFNVEFLRWAVERRFSEHGGLSTMPRPQRDQDGSDTGLLFHPGGRIEVFESSGRFELEGQPYYAIGSGRDQALGAMFAGADAATAVRAAVMHDAYCGGEVMVLRHHSDVMTLTVGQIAVDPALMAG